MNNEKKVVVINDISGIGRCSLTAAIPILSCLGIQSVPAPTAILSNQTGFDKFTFFDFTDFLSNYLNNWVEEGRKFDAIYTGFLGSHKQIKVIIDFIKKNKNAFIITDPVMGDNGVVYKTYNEEICDGMKSLVKLSDLITPNLTEACILLGIDLNINKYSLKDIKNIAKELTNLGPTKVVITGVLFENKVFNLLYCKEDNSCFMYGSEKLGGSFSGTGDIFVSSYVGYILSGIDDKSAIKYSTDFIAESIKDTIKFNGDPREGICFEKQIHKLIYPLMNK